MAIQHTKKFGIYHWDTFDNVNLLIDETDNFKTAKEKVEKKYKGRIANNGADQVDIVDSTGKVVQSFKVR